MPTDQTLISHAIQLAIAPVFLLTGIAGLLNVMATRLARVIDRARIYEDRWPALDDAAKDAARHELASLERRRRLASWSINFCTAAALLVCLVIVALFIDEFFNLDVRATAGWLFVVAMLSVVGGLWAFLREVYLATHTTSIDPASFEGGALSRKPSATSG